jgi:hypothetical protein
VFVSPSNVSTIPENDDNVTSHTTKSVYVSSPTVWVWLVVLLSITRMFGTRSIHFEPSFNTALMVDAETG